MKELNPWVLKELRYPKIDLNYDKLEDDLETKKKLYQKLKICANLEKSDHPRRVGVQIDLEIESEKKDLYARIVQEEIYEIEGEEDWKDRTEAVDTVRDIIIPKAYQDLKTYVRNLTKKAWLKPIVLKPYEELAEALGSKE